MMDYSEQPNEIDPLERLLKSGPRPIPSKELRDRVLGDVRAELRRNMLNVIRMELRRSSIRSKWRFAAAFAATVLISLGVTWGVMRETRHSLKQNQSSPTIDDVAWRLQQISPELSKEEALIQASWRQIGANAEGPTTLSDIFGFSDFGFTAKPKPKPENAVQPNGNKLDGT